MFRVLNSFVCLVYVIRLAGIGNRHWRRTHFVYHLENGLSSRCQSIQRPGRSTRLLLFGAGPEVFGVFVNRFAFQDQANLKFAPFRSSCATKSTATTAAKRFQTKIVCYSRVLDLYRFAVNDFVPWLDKNRHFCLTTHRLYNNSN